MYVFQKIGRALFSWNTRFEIRPFALLPTNLEGLFHKIILAEKIIFLQMHNTILKYLDF